MLLFPKYILCMHYKTAKFPLFKISQFLFQNKALQFEIVSFLQDFLQIKWKRLLVLYYSTPPYKTVPIRL